MAPYAPRPDDLNFRPILIDGDFEGIERGYVPLSLTGVTLKGGNTVSGAAVTQVFPLFYM